MKGASEGGQKRMNEENDGRIRETQEKCFREYIEIRARERLALSGSCGWVCREWLLDSDNKSG